jgi:hypothetical protein
MLRPALLVLPLALAMTPAAGAADEIYRTTNENGDVVFTDEPPSDDAEPLKLDPLTTVPPVQTDGAAGGTAAEQTEPTAEAKKDQTPANGISGVRLVYPPDEKGIRHNGGNVPFRVEFDPEGTPLPRGHRLVVMLDGEMRARSTGTEVVVSPVDRGPHNAKVRVVDAAGRTRFESESVKFYLLRARVGSSDN